MANGSSLKFTWSLDRRLDSTSRTYRAADKVQRHCMDVVYCNIPTSKYNSTNREEGRGLVAVFDACNWSIGIKRGKCLVARLVRLTLDAKALKSPFITSPFAFCHTF